MEKTMDKQAHTDVDHRDNAAVVSNENKSSIIEFSDSRIQKKLRDRAAGSQGAIDTDMGQVYLWKPYHLEELGELEDFMRHKDTIIFYLDCLELDEGQRMLDYFSGICYALKRPIYEAAPGTFIVSFSDDEESLLTVNDEAVMMKR